MKKLIEGNEFLLHVPTCHMDIVGRPPFVHLEQGLILNDSNCFESPLLIEGSVGSGKTTLIKQIMNPIVEYADQVHDNIVIFCAKPDMLSYARSDDPVISIHSTNLKSSWNIFAEMKASDQPYMTLREIATELFAEAEEKTTQLFFPQAARDIFYHTCRYMYDYAKKKNVNLSNAELVEFLETTPIYSIQDTPGWVELALNLLNGVGNYMLLTEMLYRSVKATDGIQLTPEDLLSSMDYILVSSIGTAGKELIKVLPDYEYEKITNTTDVSLHRDEPHEYKDGRHHRNGGGVRFSQSKSLESRCIFSQDDLVKMQDSNSMLIYNARYVHTWVAKIVG